MVRIPRRKLWASCLGVTAAVFLLVTLQVVVELGKFERRKFKNSNLQDGHTKMREEPKHRSPFLRKGALTLNGKTKSETDSYPIMLWWSPLTGETGRLSQCGADACFFTINRTYQHHHMTKAFLFYGSSMFQHTSELHSFLWLNNVLLHVHIPYFVYSSVAGHLGYNECYHSTMESHPNL